MSFTAQSRQAARQRAAPHLGKDANATAIKINAQVTGYGPQPANSQALVIVTVEFDGPSEAMTFTILVPNDGDEGIVREQAIARAQDLARRFADFRRGH